VAPARRASFARVRDEDADPDHGIAGEPEIFYLGGSSTRSSKALRQAEHGQRPRLTEEAVVVVLLYDIKELLDRCDFRVRRIAMPFRIGAHPEDLPDKFAPVEGGFGNRVLVFPALI
jgi:hypothetical protein